MFGLLKMCWEEDPELRPSFTQLVDVFTTLLESSQVYTAHVVQVCVCVWGGGEVGGMDPYAHLVSFPFWLISSFSVFHPEKCVILKASMKH